MNMEFSKRETPPNFSVEVLDRAMQKAKRILPPGASAEDLKKQAQAFLLEAQKEIAAEKKNQG